ncbi:MULTISPECIES: FAD-binding oxidoreductase [unclassified Mesorhizobium]|uniref:NAD(P)/FAD-dependent oxidoreductase n=1 Tax=unclassified Mesorhizobium TaxID=325217 RepID=UPI000FD61CE8|nr:MULTISPECIES: FAD-binding oxidoreductase [unclassified Mesorhizobium]RUV94117.1 FAD-binding oxidoreductase [Mesorhizobium sp. M5C.F.Ca.IN.020.14.1.1]RUV31803.1 FAD-binding oxidoreductase [Mesorhizobium sp. M5C.F.Ca.IN.020.32.2.1]RWG50715.1 MAG: FAD-binding oxidoreductase [Mesorhizobium sp.]RWH47614.1 MAG: FAD-binding oxidoreductase [Mesorhizobium sp.]RWH55686.1 MAG: FAD-binding oxidoreductase [Mesorhizobium sp.]
MKLASYWHDTSERFDGANAAPVSGDFDVAVVGAGFTGLNAARKLAKSGAKVALIEAQHIAYGASGRNGGHLNSGLAESFGAASAHLGEARTRTLWDAYNRSIDMIEAIVEEEAIDCSFRRSGKLKLASKPSHVARLRAMGAEIAREVDQSVRWLDKDELRSELGSDAFHGAVLYPKTAMAHMGRYANGLAAAAKRHGASIWENNLVISRQKVANGWQLTTPTGSLTARQVILSTDAYTTSAFGYFQQRIIPIASFIIATRPLTGTEVADTLAGNRTYVNSLNIANYFRLTPDNRFLFGGRARFSAASSHRTDQSSGELLRRQMLSMFPQLENVEIDYCWGGLVGCTPDRFPRAGKADGVIYAMGYSGHGAQMSTLIGNVLADIALDIKGTNPLDGMELDAVPMHTGKPWFLPVVGAYYRVKDLLP